MKKYLILLLTTLMLLTLCAFAEEEPEVFTAGDYRYILLEDGTAEIFKYSGRESDPVLPDTLDGYSVTSIGDEAFYGCGSLTTVTIPDSVTSIGEKAFCLCESLTTVTIPDSVTSIGEKAFYMCDSLTSVTIPDSVKTMGANPFTYCEKLTSIKVSVDNPEFASIDGVLFNKTTKKIICYPMGLQSTDYIIPQGILSIGDDAFYGCRLLTTVTIPDSVTSIGDEAFCYCGSLTIVTIPDSVTSIGDYAFGFCESLTTVTIPDSVTSIGDGAFCFCESLTTVTIPDSVKTMGANPFTYCEKLTSIKVSVDNPEFASIDGVLFNKTTKEIICYPMGGAIYRLCHSSRHIVHRGLCLL